MANKRQELIFLSHFGGDHDLAIKLAGTITEKLKLWLHEYEIKVFNTSARVGRSSNGKLC